VGTLLGRIGNGWVAAAASGLFVGGLLFLFPSLYGEGYPAVTGILNSDPSVIVLDGPFCGLLSLEWSVPAIAGMVCLVKGAVTSATNNGGGVAGKFAPTLFAGCLFGLFFATTANHLPGLSLDAGRYAFIGMAGVMAGTIRAPFMAVFLTSEMCGDFALFLPSALVAFVSYGISSLAGGSETARPLPD
ncbi:MAG: chloride channel protein, partial [Muribaculaceae bacterium]|nr:chloride channel protein [Muribaculaceae bacterium]